MNKLNKCEQVEQVLTDAHRCSDVGTTDFEQVSPPLDAVRLGKPFLTNDEVSPSDETALARQFQFPALRRLRTTQLGPTITGPTKTEDRRGMILHAKRSYRRDREFSRSPEGARIPRKRWHLPPIEISI